MRIEAEVIKYGDDISTDLIYPGRYTYLLLTEEQMAEHALEDLDPEFSGRNASNCVIVAGTNWGCGSAREQAASCQKVLGGFANICYEFATKRYRSNCINWGMLPFTLDADTPFDHQPGDYVFVPDVRKLVGQGSEDFPAMVLRADGSKTPLVLHVRGLTDDEREILLDGCLMNYYAKRG